jgi:ATP-dependent Lon protease
MNFTKQLNCTFRYPYGRHFIDSLARLSSEAISPVATSSVHLATSLFAKQASIVEVSQMVNTVVDKSLGKQQKERYLLQELLAIQRELANLDHFSKAVQDSPKSA